MKTLPLLPLPADWEPTRATLHAYANAVGVIPRAHATPHDLWWHISLKVQPEGLVTDEMSLPNGVSFRIRMDLRNHLVAVTTDDGVQSSLGMADGMTARAFGKRLIEMVSELGLDADYATDKFADDAERSYDPAAAQAYSEALSNINHNLGMYRASLSGEVGPLQVWPHGFDLAFEWFGTRVETYEEHGKTVETPAQLNLGFYPAGRAYLYSNPWPFNEALTQVELPAPAQWHTEGWQGSILYYDDLLSEKDPEATLMEYAQAVFAAASRTLTAE